MKPITKQTVKTASKFVTIGLLIGLLIGAFIAYGQSPSSTFTISSGVYPGAPSYTIWTEGGEYFAKDANGRLAYSGTNASQIINYAYANLPSNGGSLFLLSGTFVLGTTIYPSSNSETYGVFGATILTPPAVAIATSLISIENVQNVSIHDLVVDGASYFYCGINIAYGSNNILIDHNILKGAYDRNLWVWDAGGIAPYDIIISDNIIYARLPVAGRPSIDLVDPMVDLSQCKNVIFTNNILKGDLSPPAGASYPQILLWGGGTYDTEKITISNNKFQSHCNDFIRIVSADDVIITGNSFNYTLGSAILFQDSGSKNVVIANNIIDYANVEGIWVRLSENIIISNNMILNIGGGSTWQAITVEDSVNAVITGNLINGSYYGITITSSNDTVISANKIQNIVGAGIYLVADVLNVEVLGNVIEATWSEICLANNVDYCFIAINNVYNIYIDHTTATCDYNRFFSNIVTVLSQSAGSPTGSTYVDNYPDNTP